VLLEGPRSPASIGRLVVLDDAFAQADAEVAALIGAALQATGDLLPAPVHDDAARDGLDPWRECFRIIQARETWLTYGDFITRRRPDLGPGIRERMEFAASVTDRDVEGARRQHARVRERLQSLAPLGTILALPTAPCIAPRADTPAEELESFRLRVMRLTCIAGLGGLPQVTIPAGTISGCPVGLSFIGWPGADEILLELAKLASRHCGLQM
jgi:amidase